MKACETFQHLVEPSGLNTLPERMLGNADDFVFQNKRGFDDLHRCC